MTFSPRWAVNISTMFPEVPYPDRPSAAAAAGFTQIETWWPFPTATPTPREVATFVHMVLDSGCTLTAMNIFGGPPGSRGIASLPSETRSFRAAVSVLLEVSQELGTALFNTPVGDLDPALDAARQRETAVGNLAYAATALQGVGSIMLEPLSQTTPRQGEYPLRTLGDAQALAREVAAATGGPRPGLLLDTFHLASNGADPLVQYRAYSGEVSHIQIADAPGRGEPGSGTLNLAEFTRSVNEYGYAGAFALEYIPTTSQTTDTLDTWKTSISSLVP